MTNCAQQTSNSTPYCQLQQLNNRFATILPFHLLVLQKFMAVELAQDDACYGRMQVSRGKQVEWQYGGKSVVKLLELAIWCRV
jgi:hypothetical protein